MQPTTRRRFLELAPLAGTAMLAACSPAPAPAPGPSAAAPASPPAPAPAPEPAPAAAATPASPPPPAAAPAAAAPAAPAVAGGALVDEKEPQAVALGYVSDAARVDKAKSTNYVEGSRCANCALYQGTASADTGPCPLFQGKRVAAGGWCRSWVKKT